MKLYYRLLLSYSFGVGVLILINLAIGSGDGREHLVFSLPVLTSVFLWKEKSVKGDIRDVIGCYAALVATAVVVSVVANHFFPTTMDKPLGGLWALPASFAAIIYLLVASQNTGDDSTRGQ